MTGGFVQFEYSRFDFPVDYYGFNLQDRLLYSPRVLDYLLICGDPDFLERLTFEDGSSLFNEREVVHLVDVELLMSYFFFLALFIFVIFVIIIVISFWLVTIRSLLAKSIELATYFAVSIVVTIVLLATLNWDFFFTTFHSLFFANGTWLFEYSDTLIRLYPEQFWFDTAIAVGVITVGLALFCKIILLRLPYWAMQKS